MADPADAPESSVSPESGEPTPAPASVREGVDALRADGWRRPLVEATLDRLVRDNRFTIAVVVFDLAFDRAALVERLETCEFVLDDMVSFVLLWGGINAVYLQAVPAAVAAVLALGLVRTDRFDFAVLGGRIERLVGE